MAVFFFQKILFFAVNTIVFPSCYIPIGVRADCVWTFPCLEGSLHGQVCRGKGARCIQVGVGGFECACPEGEDGCQESSSYSSTEEEEEYGGQKVISSGDVS